MRKQHLLSIGFLFLLLTICSTAFAQYKIEDLIDNEDDQNVQLQPSVVKHEQYSMYDILSDREKKFYDSFYLAISNLKQSAVLSNSILNGQIDEKEIGNSLTALILDHPEFVWIEDKFDYVTNKKGKKIDSIEVRFTFNELGVNPKQYQKQFEDAAQKVLNIARQKGSILEMETYVFDWIDNLSRKDEGGLYQTAYAALVMGKTGNVGATKTFSYLMRKLGIPAYSLFNDAFSWNVVKINGQWYYVNATPGGEGFSNKRFNHINYLNQGVNRNYWPIPADRFPNNRLTNLWASSDVNHYKIPDPSYGSGPVPHEQYSQYFLLTDREKSVYDLLYHAVANYKWYTVIPLNLFTETSPDKDIMQAISNALLAIRIDHPEFIWITSRFEYETNRINNKLKSIEVKLKYNNIVYFNDVSDRQRQFEEKAESLVNKAKQLTAPKDIELYIFDEIARYVKYAPEDKLLGSDAYSALISNKSNSMGAAIAFNYLMKKAGIPSYVLVFDVRAWNVVKIDGEWYNVDASPSENYDPSYALNNYFNRPLEGCFWITPDKNRFPNNRLPDLVEKNQLLCTTAQTPNINQYTVNTEDSDSVKYYEYSMYNLLTNNEKQFYDTVYPAISEAEWTVVLPESTLRNGFDNDELHNAVLALRLDHPEFVWLDIGYSYQERYDSGRLTGVVVYLKYNFFVENPQMYRKKFEDAAEALLVQARKKGSLLAAEQYIFEYLHTQVKYSPTENYLDQTAYDVLVYNQGVCAGVAITFNYLMRRLGLPSFIVTGDTNTEGSHAWNIVKYNGTWYYVDSTPNLANSITQNDYKKYFNVSLKGSFWATPRNYEFPNNRLF